MVRKKESTGHKESSIDHKLSSLKGIGNLANSSLNDSNFGFCISDSTIYLSGS